MGLAYFVIVLFSNHYQTYITTATFISITARFYNRSCTYFFILKKLMIGYTTYQWWWWNLKYIHIEQLIKTHYSGGTKNKVIQEIVVGSLLARTTTAKD